MFIGIKENDSTQGNEESEYREHKGGHYNFMGKGLHIENAQSRFEFQRVHRLGKPKGRNSRPIITRFLRYSDCEEDLYQAKKRFKTRPIVFFKTCPKNFMK